MESQSSKELLTLVRQEGPVDAGVTLDMLGVTDINIYLQGSTQLSLAHPETESKCLVPASLDSETELTEQRGRGCHPLSL